MHTRGFIAHDEGLLVNPSYRFLNGEIPYKDFQFYYFPGSLFVYSFILSVSESLLALRIDAILSSVVSVFLIYKITFAVSSKKVLTYLLVILFVLFGPLTINFLTPTMLAVPSALAAIYLLSKKPITSRSILFSGIACGLTLLFKQNLAGAVLISSFTGIFLLSGEHRTHYLSRYLLGLTSVILLVGVYLLAIGALNHFLSGIIYFIYDKTILMGLQVTPFIYPDTPLKQLGKTFFYILPFLLSVCAIFTSLKSKKTYLSYVVFTLFFYLFGIRPTTDYIHLAPLLALSVIPLAVIYKTSKKPLIKACVYLLTIVLILTGAFTVLSRHYYRWDRPLSEHSIFFPHPRVNIFVHQDALSSIKELDEIVSSNKTGNKYLFLYDFMPMYYFLTDTRNPTRFDFIPPLSDAEEDEIISDIQKSDTKLIVTYSNLQEDNSKIGRFIRQNYLVKKYPRFFAWRKT